MNKAKKHICDQCGEKVCYINPVTRGMSRTKLCNMCYENFSTRGDSLVEYGYMQRSENGYYMNREMLY